MKELLTLETSMRTAGNTADADTLMRIAKLLDLAAAEVVAFTNYDVGTDTWTGVAYPVAMVGDAFGVDDEDAESVALADVDALFSAFLGWGEDGVIAWVAKRRGVAPQPAWQNGSYAAAYASIT